MRVTRRKGPVDAQPSSLGQPIMGGGTGIRASTGGRGGAGPAQVDSNTNSMFSVPDLTAIINQLLPEPHAGLLSGIVFGTKATLSKDLMDALITTGTLHIVALSGMNITIMANLMNLGLLHVINRRVASFVTILLIIGFVWFVGPSASIIRAAIMGIISLIAIIFGRQSWALLSWLLAVGTMLLLNPSWMVDLSFQLSILATLGIILFGSKKESNKSIPFPHPASHILRHTSLLWSILEPDLRITLAAQIFTIPLIFLAFYRISLISPLTNVLITWLLAPLTLLGWVVAVLGLIWLPLGQLVAWISWVPLQYLISIITLTSKIPLASIGS